MLRRIAWISHLRQALGACRLSAIMKRTHFALYDSPAFIMGTQHHIGVGPLLHTESSRMLMMPP
jgi:hypothetical protein